MFPADGRPAPLHVVHDPPPEPADWEAVYREHVTEVYRFVYARVGNRADAEDVTSTTFMRALPHLTSDVLAIADQSGWERFCLAGHDWGAAVAWNVALQSPQRVSRLMILNVPHPAVMLRHLKRSPSQMIRSWYILFFQLPWLPERILAANNFRLLASSLLRTSRRGTFSDEDLRRYRQAWAQPGALRAMISWYRAAARHQPKIKNPLVRVPTKVLWGVHDPFLRFRMAEESLRYCEKGELARFDNCTHWLQHEAPERVNKLMIGFFRE